MDQWIAFCAFHLGDYKRSMDEYEVLSVKEGINPDVWVNLACCYFFLGMYPQSDEAAKKCIPGNSYRPSFRSIAYKEL